MGIEWGLGVGVVGSISDDFGGWLVVVLMGEVGAFARWGWTADDGLRIENGFGMIFIIYVYIIYEWSMMG